MRLDIGTRPARPRGRIAVATAAAAARAVLGFAGVLGLACVSLSACGRAPTSRSDSLPIARRVVALAPNLTEVVFAVGAGRSLVGVSDFSDYPPEAASVARVGGLDPSAERVASLHPDLVLATAEGGNRRGAVSAVEAAGIPVLLVPGGSLDDVLAGIRLIGSRVGHGAEAERVARSLAQRRDQVAPFRRRPAASARDPARLAGAGAGRGRKDVPRRRAHRGRSGESSRGSVGLAGRIERVARDGPDRSRGRAGLAGQSPRVRTGFRFRFAVARRGLEGADRPRG